MIAKQLEVIDLTDNSDTNKKTQSEVETKDTTFTIVDLVDDDDEEIVELVEDDEKHVKPTKKNKEILEPTKNDEGTKNTTMEDEEIIELKKEDAETETTKVVSTSEFQFKEPAGTTDFRKLKKSLENAIEEIKKGGSLKKVSTDYKIPEELLYQNLVAREVPKENELLTTFEENNLVRWVLRSNESNNLVTKQSLLEKVGKMKKVLKITPIFGKSKFGKMWYEYFIKTHLELIELDGIIVPSANCRRVLAQKSKRKSQTQTTSPVKIKKKENAVESKKKSVDWFLLYGLKKAVIVLQDFKRLKTFDYIEKDNGLFTKIKNDIEIFTLSDSESEKDFHGFENRDSGSISSVKDTSNTVKSPSELCELKESANQNNIYCEKCEYSFRSRYQLKHHHLRFHTKQEVHRFVCFKCKKRFPTQKLCKLHMASKHSKNLCKCETCGEEFQCLANLQLHIKTVHAKTETTDLQCDVCQKRFTTEKDLKRHIKCSHLKGEKIECDICGKNFITPTKLSKHRLKHKNKSLPCPCCPRKFSGKYSLQKHVNICIDKRGN